MHMPHEIRVLELTAIIMGETNRIYPSLLVLEDGLTLVDCGYPGQLPLILQAIEKEGFSIADLKRIVLTHHDIDHIGSLPDVLALCAGEIEVCAHRLERPHIEGELPLAKVTTESLAQLDLLPEPHRSALKRVLEHPPSAPVGRLVGNNDILDSKGNVEIIETAGHTMGHISLYHRPSRTLIAGDSLIIANGMLNGPIPEQSIDSQLALRSLELLLTYDIERVVCYHGGIYSDTAEAIRDRISFIASQRDDRATRKESDK
ncbi:hypothetical protein B1748_05390 [Paenibacillus sp. MY03]|uniref:MBL fold metallo-hydrolase n=1 Tax=Paenibacillus sp. MY03 TaxID=302980 RepID=UPI000B3D227C|nr:MBL fold metallo-hydrolase [Paenibacillus sp. MY03]OUS78192.1 hypothetical protein B1748_05390 [Paenibacillus sp. MY03]